MKVLHILNELKYSGAEIMYVDAARYFQESGCELSVVATADNLGSYSYAFKDAGYDVIHLPYPAGLSRRIKYCKHFIRLLKEQNIDIVHIHAHRMMWTISMCSWIAGRKSVYTFHNVFHSSWYSYLKNYLKRKTAKHVFGCTFHTISDSVYENEKTVYHNDTVKIYNWYGDTRFYPAEEGEKSSFRKELSIPEDNLVLISIGGCSHVKRHSDVIKAINELSGKCENITYIHLGEGKTLDEESKLAEELNVPVNFYGNQSDVRRFLIASDIYLMPSKHEGLSITAIEALACGVPSILYDVPGLRDFNYESKCSMLIPEDYRELANAIMELKNNPVLQEEITANAVKFVNEKFSLKKNAKKIYDLYIS